VSKNGEEEELEDANGEEEEQQSASDGEDSDSAGRREGLLDRAARSLT
jgi:hypothetical protein